MKKLLLTMVVAVALTGVVAAQTTPQKEKPKKEAKVQAPKTDVKKDTASHAKHAKHHAKVSKKKDS